MGAIRSTKIVATIGPASRQPEVLRQMIEAGMDVARLNFAHASPEQHADTVERIRAAAAAAGREVAVLQDVPGPKLRLGPIAGDVAQLPVGSDVTLVAGEDEEAGNGRLPVAWPGFAELVEEGQVVYLADGAIRLRVSAVVGEEVRARVEVGGTLASRQGINLPNVTVSLPAVSGEDLAFIDAGVAMGVDFIALSFVRRREDMEPVRRHLGDRQIPLIAKIEKPLAASNADEIIDDADGVMVARGDLGIELPIEQVPLVQKRILQIAGRKLKPSITATQMLESMVQSTRPTRAEVADVANAIFDGTDAVMLSQETAVGQYPVEAVAMMASIAIATERQLPYGRFLTERAPRGDDEAATIAFGAVGASYQLGLKALVVPTMSGGTARVISAHRPQAPVLALSPRPDVVRRCCLLWGVRGELNQEPEGTTALIEACAAAARRCGFADSGDKIGITAGLPAHRVGGTNLFKVHRLE
jgi:pyruvate kinase